MPLWKDSKSENFKAKLEHKMCIAKEAPDETFDLADCNLPEVPSGVYSMCRVFRKERLVLQNNRLTNLLGGGSMKDLSQLQVLDLKDNKISSLPDDISHLTKLKVLNLENNQLKKLPLSFEKLVNLRHLNLKSNKLLEFPLHICSLHNLKTLNLCSNPKIKTLPKELCELIMLKDLQIDAENFTYPTQDICLGGTEQIMQYLCEEMGREYCPTDVESISEAADCDVSDVPSSERRTSDVADLSASYLQYQRTKERRLQDLIVMEEALKENFAAQSSVTADSSNRRQKLLNDIVQDQERMESEILQLQSKKEKDKKNLLSVLINIENHSAELIDTLMSLNDRTKDLEKMAAVLERDRIENEEIFSIKQEALEQLRKREILEAMTEMLQYSEKSAQNELERSNMVEKLQNEDNENNLKLFNIFRERDLDQHILMDKLLKEEEYQKEAFEVLQLQKDIRHQEIAHKIELIEKELSNLTVAELKKKDLKISSELNVLADHRIALASLLSDLMAAKEEREIELKERLHQMEEKRALEMEDFWLIQYQNLLDRKPKGIIDAELGVDDDVKIVLLDVGATEYLPLFASKRITFSQLLNFTLKDLKKMGILDNRVCDAILLKVQEHYNQTLGPGMKYRIPEFSNFPAPSAPSEPETPTEDPSAPPEPEMPTEDPSAPPMSPDAAEVKLWCQTECVICLDVQTSAVFLPCGHVCCCQNCSDQVELCPMCRTTIASKFILTVS